MAINSKENEQIRQKNKDSNQKIALHWNQFANERLFEISKQLLAIAFIILPLTGSIVLSDKMISPENIRLLVLGWISLFVSIISGFINFWIEANYFHDLSNDSSKRELLWSDSNRKVSEIEKDIKKLGTTEPNSSFLPLIMQGSFLCLGVFLIMLVVYGLLLQNSTKSTSIHYSSHHKTYTKSYVERRYN